VFVTAHWAWLLSPLASHEPGLKAIAWNAVICNVACTRVESDDLHVDDVPKTLEQPARPRRDVHGQVVGADLDVRALVTVGAAS
jgi:hypothetical protein